MVPPSQNFKKVEMSPPPYIADLRVTINIIITDLAIQTINTRNMATFTMSIGEGGQHHTQLKKILQENYLICLGRLIC